MIMLTINVIRNLLTLWVVNKSCFFFNLFKLGLKTNFYSASWKIKKNDNINYHSVHFFEIKFKYVSHSLCTLYNIYHIIVMYVKYFIIYKSHLSLHKIFLYIYFKLYILKSRLTPKIWITIFKTFYR